VLLNYVVIMLHGEQRGERDGGRGALTTYPHLAAYLDFAGVCWAFTHAANKLLWAVHLTNTRHAHFALPAFCRGLPVGELRVSRASWGELMWLMAFVDTHDLVTASFVRCGLSTIVLECFDSTPRLRVLVFDHCTWTWDSEWDIGTGMLDMSVLNARQVRVVAHPGEFVEHLCLAAMSSEEFAITYKASMAPVPMTLAHVCGTFQRLTRGMIQMHIEVPIYHSFVRFETAKDALEEALWNYADRAWWVWVPPSRPDQVIVGILDLLHNGPVHNWLLFADHSGQGDAVAVQDAIVGMCITVHAAGECRTYGPSREQNHT